MVRIPAVVAASPFKWATVLATKQQISPFLLEAAAQTACPVDTTPPSHGHAVPALPAALKLAGMSAAARQTYVHQQVDSVVRTVLGPGNHRVGDDCCY